MKFKPLETAFILAMVLIAAFYMAPVLKKFVTVSFKTAETIKAVNVVIG